MKQQDMIQPYTKDRSNVVVPTTLATLIGLSLYSEHEVRQAEAQVPPIGQFVTVEGLRLHYVRQGAGRPVVFLHGNDGQLQDFTLSLLDRAAQDYDVLAFDRPGHGYSERPRAAVATPHVQARLLRGALQALEVDRPILVGHSWSGGLALLYALAYPEDLAGLVVLGGYVYHQGGPHPLAALPTLPVLGDLYLYTLGVPLWRRLVVHGLKTAFAPDTPPPAYVSVVQALSPRPGQSKATAEDFQTLNTTLRAVSPHYGQIRAPLRIISGAADRVVPPEQHAYALHRAVPHSRLVMVPHTGHMLQFSRPDVIMGALAELCG
jgi:pimeloyl-ACP methyl ester carboxylesterase